MKVFWVVLGLVCLCLGSVGIVLPILPTVPFYLATVFCFTKGSKRLHRWFVGTKLYEKYLESYVKEKRMTMAAKVKLCVTVTIVMGIGFFMMKEVPVGRIILAIVWISHIIVVFFKIETKPVEIEEKRQKEQQVVTRMIELYCRKKHKDCRKDTVDEKNTVGGHKKYTLCEDCRRLSEYAVARSEKCPFMENKTFCSNCKVHCYKPEMREEIRKVMRFSGPRMLLYHPGMAIWHVVTGFQEKRKEV